MESIGKRAFADCPNLTALVIPESVTSIDDTALQGSPNATVYGKTGSAAQTFAQNNEFPFVATDPPTVQARSYEAAQPPVVMPYVALG